MGAGPAGALLALLLARRGIAVTLLEAQADFDREFRGDTIHPSTMELLDGMGLADRLLELPHTKLRRATIQTPAGAFTPFDLGRLDTRFPYITLLPQERFLEFLTGEAARLPTFHLEMRANVKELIREDGAVRGVRYPSDGGWREVRAPLTVGTDGRFSKLRRLAALAPIRTSPPMDVLWFRLPRDSRDPAGGALGRVQPGRILVLLDRQEHWQAGYVIPKGSYRALRAEGLDALRRAVADMAPEVADRVGLLDWDRVSLLQVESDRLPRWYIPGLLLLGDAAHVMSPVLGVGINYAVQDAVEAANVLTGPLQRREVDVGHLREVQRRREWPTRVIQAIQAQVQARILRPALAAEGSLRVPAALRLLFQMPLLRDLPARLFAFGIRPVRLEA